MTTDEKREALASKDMEADEESLFNVFMDGCRGYNHYTDEAINELYAEIIGEEEEK